MSVEVIDAPYFEAIEPMMSGTEQKMGLNEIEGRLRASVPNRQTARAAFMAGETDNPDLRPDISLQVIDRSIVSLYGLSYLMHERAEPVVNKAYQPRIGELLDNARTLKGAALRSGELFLEGGKGRFGTPNIEDFNRSLSAARLFAESADSPAGRAFLDNTPVADNVPPPQTHQEFQAVQKLFAPVVAEISSVIGEIPARLTGREVIAGIRKVIDYYDFGYTAGPQAPGLSTMAVRHASKQVLVPEDRIYEDPLYVLGMNLHEVWIHVNEAVEGAKQPLRLVQRGLDRSLISGEGKGLVAEQIIYPSYEAFMQTPRARVIIRRQLAIGAARGLMTGELMDFREVYDTIHRFDLIEAHQKHADSNAEAVQMAHDNTWELLSMRTQKGVTGKGMASVQDMVYGQGSGPQMRLLANNPEVFPYLNLGKYNLLDPNHVAILEEVGIIPGGIVAQSRG